MTWSSRSFRRKSAMRFPAQSLWRARRETKNQRKRNAGVAAESGKRYTPLSFRAFERERCSIEVVHARTPVIARYFDDVCWFSGAPDAKPAPPAGGLLVVANQKEHTLLVVDPDNRRELAKISVGVNGHEVIVSKDNRFAYVPIYGNSGVGKPGTDGSTIDVIDLQERKLAATIDLGKPLRPHRAEFGTDGLLYVTAEMANAVDVIDPSTRKVLAEIPTGEPQSHMLVLSRDGRAPTRPTSAQAA